MKITPLDIQHKTFQTQFRGYQPREVNQFLDELAESVEELIRENTMLRDKLLTRDDELSQLKQAESTLTNTLIATQNFSDQLRQEAQQDADRILKDAELRSEEMLLQTRTMLADLQRSFGDLQRQRVLAVEQFRGMLKSFESVLALEDQDSLSSPSRSQEVHPSSQQGYSHRRTPHAEG
ncbi:MAG: DivIVA domain-containing protein [Nitrospirales bacterium]|nr:DivIVA domain-containing protein [Nitrospirales bacterium]